MRKKTAKNLAGIKGRSKIPIDLSKWMSEVEKKNSNIAKLDIEYNEGKKNSGILRSIYYTNENNKWNVFEIKETEFSHKQADDFFESKAMSKADFLIKIIEDQTRIKGMLDCIYNEEEEIITPETDRSIRLAFANIQRRIRPDMFDKLQVENNKYILGLRRYDFFTDRSGEEDDDHPNFNTKDQLNIRDIATNELQSFGIKYKRLLINSSEKSWFSIEVYL